MQKTSILFSAASVLTAALAFGLPGEARAQSVSCEDTDEFPCNFQIQAVELQPVPTLFKFQARVSQAKLPVGEGRFDTLYVNLKRGDESLCTEEFSQVRVDQSVLNLEIGRNMSCELDQVIAENQDLFFQICIGGQRNCLRPISLATVPYAVKSTFAAQSQEAHTADRAGQAHYAHRATADRELFITNRLGTGYFDFHTHNAAPELYDDAEYSEFEKGGFLQWTPMHEGERPTLHITAKDKDSDQPQRLHKLVLYSRDVYTTGGLTVQSRGARVTGDSLIDGNTSIIGQLKVEKGPPGGPVGAHVSGNSTFDGRLRVDRRLTISSEGAIITGDVIIEGHLSADEALLAGNTQIGLDPADNSTLQVKTFTTFEDDVVFLGNVAFAGGDGIGDIPFLSNTGGVLDGDLDITGNLRVRGELTVDQQASFGTDVRVRNRVQFTNAAGGVIASLTGSANVGGNPGLETGQSMRVTGSLLVGDDLTVTENAHVGDDLNVDDDINMDGTLRFRNGSRIEVQRENGQDVTEELRIFGGLEVEDSLYIQGGITGIRVDVEDCDLIDAGPGETRCPDNRVMSGIRQDDDCGDNEHCVKRLVCCKLELEDSD